MNLKTAYIYLWFRMQLEFDLVVTEANFFVVLLHLQSCTYPEITIWGTPQKVRQHQNVPNCGGVALPSQHITKLNKLFCKQH